MYIYRHRCVNNQNLDSVLSLYIYIHIYICTHTKNLCVNVYIYTKADIYIYTYLCIGTQYTIKGNCFLMKNCKLENALNLYIYISKDTTRWSFLNCIPKTFV